MEDQSVRLVRLRHSITYPADFILVGAANPCRCGEYFEPNDRCRCTDDSVRQHLNRLSGPLLDRIDLTVEMTRLRSSDLPLCVKRQHSTRKSTGELSAEISRSWQIQKQRCLRQGLPVTANGRMHGQDLLKMLELSPTVAEYAASAGVGLNLSVRGYQRILRMARTIADLEAAAEVTFAHVAEAMQFRIRMP